MLSVEQTRNGRDGRDGRVQIQIQIQAQRGAAGLAAQCVPTTNDTLGWPQATNTVATTTFKPHTPHIPAESEGAPRI